MSDAGRTLILARDRLSNAAGWKDIFVALSRKEEEVMKVVRQLHAHLEDRPDDLVLALTGLEETKVVGPLLLAAFGLVEGNLERLAQAAIARHPELTSRARAWSVTNG